MLIDNIIILARRENKTLTELEKLIGASKGVLTRAAKKKTDIQSKWATLLVENYPQYSAEWLLTGKGLMLRSNEDIEEQKSEYDIDLPDSESIDFSKAESAKEAYTLLERKYKALTKELKKEQEYSKKAVRLLDMYEAELDRQSKGLF